MELSREFRERFVKNLQGRDFILYGGLLELVKQQGLRRITTNVIQVPSDSNNMYAVVEAEIELGNGEVYKEIGDASPKSVNRTIEPHILRMASTRAKARAFRDAIGIDMVALEELGDIASEEEIPFETDLGDYVVRFGKYANKTLREIMSIDRDYVEWLGENAKEERLRVAAHQTLRELEH
jgi:hypothetical protein